MHVRSLAQDLTYGRHVINYTREWERKKPRKRPRFLEWVIGWEWEPSNRLEVEDNEWCIGRVEHEPQWRYLVESWMQGPIVGSKGCGVEI